MKTYHHSRIGGRSTLWVNPVFDLFSRMIAIFGVLMMFAVSGWGADTCTTTVDHAFTTTPPNNTHIFATSNVGSDKEEFYYISVPVAGTLTLSNLSANTTIYYSKTGCATSSSASVGNGGTITLTESGNIYLLAKSGNANAAISFTLTFAPKNAYQLVVDSVVVNEAVGNAIVNIRIDPAISPYDTVSVHWATSDVSPVASAMAGSDYTSGSATLTITSTSINTISIPIANTSGYEPQEYFNVILSSPAIITSSGSTVTIADGSGDVIINDLDTATSPTLSINDRTVIENAGLMTFTVTRSATDTTNPVTFSYTTSDGTAVQPTDYTLTTGTGTIAAGTDHTTISVPIIDDVMASEGSETFLMTISNPSSGTLIGDGSGEGTITDNDSGLTLAINDAQIAESDSNITANVNLVLSEPAPAGGVVVTYHTTNGTATASADYTAVIAGTVTIPEGNITFPIPLTITGDDSEEGLEDFNITIDSATASVPVIIADPIGKITIFDDDGVTGGCSSYMGMMTINEYQNNPNYFDSTHPLAAANGKVPGNYIEVKYLDLLVKQFLTDAWTISVYSTAGTDTLTWDEADSDCADPRYDIFEMSNNVMGARGYVVIKDANGNEVDLLNIDDSDHYTQGCTSFVYDTDFTSSAQNKDLFRDPDGTGDWYDQGSGANSGGSRCINRDGGGEVVYTIFDAIDTDVTLPAVPLNANFILKTKVVSKPSDIKIVSLDINDSVPNDPLVPITAQIKAYLVDMDTLNRIDPSTTYDVVFNNTSFVTLTGTSFAKAHKRVRVQFEYCEISGVVQNSTSCWNATTDQTILDQRRISQSRDRFAIRPDIFSSGLTSSPYKYEAGDAEAIIFQASAFGGTAATDYNETEHTSFVVDVNISDSTKSCAQPSINFSPDINFTNGTNIIAGVTPEYSLPNVGDFNVTMHEIMGSEYAITDVGDSNDTVRLITPFTAQIKVIPDHFTIDGNFTNGSNGFTYLSNFEVNASLDQNVSALVDANITAKDFGGVTTTNYTSSCYAKDGNVSLAITLPVITPANHLHQLLWYDDLNTTNDGNFTLNISYASLQYSALRFVSGDSNGTGNIRYRFNFDRNQTMLVDPFTMIITEINATDNDLATGNQPWATNNSAYYVYGRVIPRDIRVFGGGMAFVANGWYEVYNTPNINGTFLSASKNDSSWYINRFHDELNDGDSNVTQLQINGAASVLQNPAWMGNTIDGMDSYGKASGLVLGSYKAHIDTNPWLWYGINALDYVDPATGNTDAACVTHPCFNINVVPPIGATGSAKSGGEDTKANKASSGGTGWHSTTDYAPAIR